MAINPYKQIDAIFFYIKKKIALGASINSEYIWNLFVDKTPELEINKLMFSEIISKLIEDGYITELRKANEGQDVTTYHVTFKGQIFEGYESQQKLLNEQKARLADLENRSREFQDETTNNAKRLNVLTVILALGTSIAAIYYLLEILNNWVRIYPTK